MKSPFVALPTALSSLQQVGLPEDVVAIVLSGLDVPTIARLSISTTRWKIVLENSWESLWTRSNYALSAASLSLCASFMARFGFVFRARRNIARRFGIINTISQPAPYKVSSYSSIHYMTMSSPALGSNIVGYNSVDSSFAGSYSVAKFLSHYFIDISQWPTVAHKTTAVKSQLLQDPPLIVGPGYFVDRSDNTVANLSSVFSEPKPDSTPLRFEKLPGKSKPTYSDRMMTNQNPAFPWILVADSS